MACSTCSSFTAGITMENPSETSEDSMKCSPDELLFIEPYYGGSHKDFIDCLHREFRGHLYTLPPTKWNWRMRISALHFAEVIPRAHKYSSVLNLSELVALRPDIATLEKILFFHENQLVYPVRKQQDRDFQHGYSQILSCLVADTVIFNSEFNKESFLSSISTFMKIVPDFRPKNLREKIEPKCSVQYVPIQTLSLNVMPISGCSTNERMKDSMAASASHSHLDSKPLHLLWPHRWEHDKNPDMFCSLLLKLLDHRLNFVVSILGSHTNDIPACFLNTIPILGERLLNKGHVPREVYSEVLASADVVVSTAKHEFFGVAMLEAVFCGCYPLCPNQLVYPEIYPRECLYNTEEQLFKKVKEFCIHPSSARQAGISGLISIERFSWDNLKMQYNQYFRH